MTGTEHIPFWVIVKNGGYIVAFFLGLSVHSYGILGAFMVIDTALGIMRVHIVHGRAAVKSMRMTSGIMSKVLIIGVPIIIAYAGKGIGLDLTSPAAAAISVLILSHTYSILGNIHSIYLRRDIYEFDAVSWALTKIQLFIERLMKAGAPDKMDNTPHTNRDLTTKQ